MSIKGLQLVRHLNSVSSTITRPHRLNYLRSYRTVMVNPDGSSVTIRYHEPRHIIKVSTLLHEISQVRLKEYLCTFQMPVNVWTLSEAERKERMERRKPKHKVKIEEDIDDGFDSNTYLQYLKKK